AIVERREVYILRKTCRNRTSACVSMPRIARCSTRARKQRSSTRATSCVGRFATTQRSSESGRGRSGAGATSNQNRVPPAPRKRPRGWPPKGDLSMTSPNVPQDPVAPKFELARREIADAIRREWGRLGEHADELSATAEAVTM